MNIFEFYKTEIQETFSVAELIDLLSKYPKEMKIVITWESTIQGILKRNIYTSKEENFLFLDADGCFYKQSYAKDPKENENE